MKTFFRTTKGLITISRVSIKEIIEQDKTKCVKLRSGRIIIKEGEIYQYHESFLLAKQYLIERITNEIKQKEEEIENLMKDFSKVECMKESMFD